MKRNKKKLNLKEVAENVIRILKPGLIENIGRRQFKDSDDSEGYFEPGKMCVEQAVHQAEGGDGSQDHPACVLVCIAEIKIELNDRGWNTNKSREKGMRKIAVAQLGSNQINEQVFRLCLLQAFLDTQPLYMKYWGRKFKRGQEVTSQEIRDLNELIVSVTDTFVDSGPDEIIDMLISGAHLETEKPEPQLLFAASVILEALKRCKSPGCKYLYLCGK